jgi:hypothetical protein
MVETLRHPRGGYCYGQSINGLVLINKVERDEKAWLVCEPDKAHTPPAKGLPKGRVHHARVTPGQTEPAALLAKPELGDARETRVEAANGDTSGNGAARAEVVACRERGADYTNSETA